MEPIDTNIETRRLDTKRRNARCKKGQKLLQQMFDPPVSVFKDKYFICYIRKQRCDKKRQYIDGMDPLISPQDSEDRKGCIVDDGSQYAKE